MLIYKMSSIFIKHNHTQFEDSLLKEADGLKALSDALSPDVKVITPKIYEVDENSMHLEKIYSASPSKEQYLTLGKELAKMHKRVYEFYGYAEDNHIGLSLQKNILSKNWGEFFIIYRLNYQLSLIQDKAIQSRFQSILDANKKKLESFLNDTTKHPSLLHGDLWSGNVMFDNEYVYLIDPAAYYGDREVDIAMTEMFGGFDREFYDSYEKEYPKSKHYNTKKIIYNLYHYLNHYNLFGHGYLGGCEDGFELIKSL